MSTEVVRQVHNEASIESFAPGRHEPRSLPEVPIPLTPLIGREHDVVEIIDLLRQSETRLVTITGPGGVGKTRLAIEVANGLAPDYPDGVGFVSLAHVRDPDLAGSALALALNIPDTGERSDLERLMGFLRYRDSLLVLDNFEQILPAASLIATLLEACPRVKLLVTSRARLRVRGERETPINPLPLPGPDTRVTVEMIENYSSMALFQRRAREVFPDFAVTESNIDAVAEICRRLDGLPLAIELAAARTKLLSPAAMLSRLELRLPLLTGGPRDLPVRQQTMRDAIAWTYDLLDPAEQTLFHRLTVFSGGFTLEAAERICDSWPPGNAPEPLDVLAGIDSLVDKHLVHPVEQALQRGEEPRFDFLETIREFGLEQLVASGELAEAQRRHAEWARELAEQHNTHFFGPNQHHRLGQLDNELENLNGALRWAAEQQKAEHCLCQATALWRYWSLRNQSRQGCDWLDIALSLPGAREVDSEVRARARNARANLALDQSDFSTARGLYDEVLDIRRRVGDHRGVAACLSNLAFLANYQGQYERACELMREAIPLFRAADDFHGLSNGLAVYGRALSASGHHQEALAKLNEAVEIQSTHGDTMGETYSRIVLAEIALSTGTTEDAIDHFEHALSTMRLLGDKRGIGFCLGGLGRTIKTTDPAKSATYHIESLSLRWNSGDRRGIAENLEGLASTANARGRFTRAAKLLGASSSIRTAIDAPVPSYMKADVDEAASTARAALGMAAFSTAWAAGMALPLDEAVAEGMREAGADEVMPPVIVQTTPSAPASQVPPEAERLTQREWEVLKLVAEGCTDKEIADQLFISPRTSMQHVAHILAKLEVNSRTAAAAFALRYGLA